MNKSKSLIVLAVFAVLAACSDKEVILEGKRLAVRAPLFDDTAELTPQEEPQAPVSAAFEAAAPATNASWTHTAGNATHLPGHPAVSSAPKLIWTAGIGTGNTRKHRITADPVIADGRVFTMDSRSHVTAVSSGGARLWSVDLTPPEERNDDASGGGLAIAGDKLFATTGFGEVVALNPGNGAELWRQALDAPATSSPTVVDDLVYVVSRDNRAWAIRTDNGRVKWQLPGTPDVSGVVGGAGPAVTDRVAIFPFGNGEIVAALRQGGVRLWGSSVSGKRRGPAYANITDIVADPVVVGDVIYTGNQSGRAVAIDLNSGNRIWTARDGAYGTVAVAGNSVFLISDQAELIRLDAETGEKIWGIELPYFRRERARRSKAIFAHYGPVLAGGSLWVASDDGTLKSYDPATGATRATIDLPGGAASNISVAGGTIYVISERGQLHAFR
ncbi:MAG: PQQ-like beta-propeller repeat protein [Rhodobacter sp.]|nr:PQQ-like beta-propeller repeat protein [Rhodobacter sp.]